MINHSCDQHEVEVYRTNVTSRSAADWLLGQLYRYFPGWCISFDLEDCDRVLRVESPGVAIPTDFIAALLQENGYGCEPLPE
jgi:hypothetical protein